MSELTKTELRRRRGDADVELQRVLSGEHISPVYQPIVELETGRVVAFEALARGPHGSILEYPNALFGAAARQGRLEALDWACRSAAMQGAFDADLLPPAALFVNVEPVAAGQQVPAQYAALSERAQDGLRVVFEFTERALTDHPSDVLCAVRSLRALGALIALDDVGVDPRSLALLPFLEPEVVKLDMTLTHDHLARHTFEVMAAVQAHAERTGALVLAEGIENEEHLAQAKALGATYGQGWLFGKPGPLPRTHDRAAVDLFAAQPRTPVDADLTPYAWLEACEVPRGVMTHSELAAAWAAVLDRAAAFGESAVVLASGPPPGDDDAVHATLSGLVRRAAFVGRLSSGSARPAAGLRTGTLAPSEPLAAERTICILSPHLSVVLVARDHPSQPGRLRYRLSHDRDVVACAARRLMGRITGEASAPAEADGT